MYISWECHIVRIECWMICRLIWTCCTVCKKNSKHFYLAKLIWRTLNIIVAIHGTRMIAVNIKCIYKRICFVAYVREITALLEHFKIPYAKWRTLCCGNFHHVVFIKWNHFPRNRSFMRWIHRSPMNSPHKGQWRGALIFSFIWAWINGWVNKHEAGD